MTKLNIVVLNFLACVANKDIQKDILSENVFKLVSLPNIKPYTESEFFKSKKVTEANYDQCLKFALKNLNDEKFRKYLEDNKICYIAFYPKTKISDLNLLDLALVKSNPTMSQLHKVIVKYDIVENVLNLYINPIKSFKEKVELYSENILKYFNDNGQNVDTLNIKFIYNNTEIDDIGETLLDLGFSIKTN